MVQGKPAKILKADDGGQIRLVFYHLSNADFHVVRDLTLTRMEIASAEVFAPVVREEIYRDQSVPVFTSTKKSKLGRAVVGGLVAGPAGAVIGAMTGVGHKIEVHNKTQRVFSHHAERSGKPFLLINTVSGDRYEVNLGLQSLHETWLTHLDNLSSA